MPSVLIVEDDLMIADMTEEFLVLSGYSVCGIARTVDAAIALARTHYPDLALIDLRLADGGLGTDVATSARTEVLQATIQEMKILVEDKDRLLDQKKVLAEELQHRVRNNLQLIYGMLTKQLDETSDEAGQRGLRAIARRVFTLAKVYESLLGTEMTHTTDFGTYVKSLCVNLAEIQDVNTDHIELICEGCSLMLDLDMVTALGIIVAELVTNSYDHAFPEGNGKIRVSLIKSPDMSDRASLIITDDGIGFVEQPGSKRHGVGLVRRLVEQIGGDIRLVSDHGTVWAVTFPSATTPPVTFERPASTPVDGALIGSPTS